MSNFAGLNTALTGIRAGQYGLDTAAHNVANAATKGYTRQRVNLSASTPYASPVGPMGTGVSVNGIARLRDGFLDARVRSTLGQFVNTDTRHQLLARTETVLGEPDHGIHAALGDLWNAFEDLAMDPAGAGPRRQVIGTLETLTSRIRSVASGWDDLRRDTEQRLRHDVDEANDLLARVNELNRTIVDQRSATGQLPSDLLDERDNHLDRLAELVGASFSERDGVVTVVIGGSTMPLELDPPKLLITEDGTIARSDGAAAPVLGGQIGATVTFLTRDLRGLEEQLATFATDLAGLLNTQHARGTDQDGQLGLPLLVGIGSDLRVNPDIAANPRKLAVGLGTDPGDGSPGPWISTTPNDPGNALALAGLRSAEVGGSKTIGRAYDALTVGLSSGVATARRAAEAQHSLAVAAESARLGMHGVSLDEEMADIVKFSRSLEAMSRVMTAIDEALNVLVNRTGIVGR